MSSLPDLTDEFIADSYKGILHTANQPVTGTELKQVYDGLGNKTGLSVSSTTIGVGSFIFPSTGNFGETLMIDAGGNLTLGNIFPVGAVYFTTSNINPSTYLGGTWGAICEGRFIAGVGTGNDGTYTKTISAGNSGGTYKHLLSESELPSHTHTGITASMGASGDVISVGQPTLLDGVRSEVHQNSGHTSNDGAIKTLKLDGQVFLNDTGNNQPHENSPPTFGLYVWTRLA